MIGMAFVLAGWFVGRVIYGYVHHFAFRLSQEIHAAYIEIYPENPPHFAPKKSILTPIKTKISQPYYCLFFALLFALCDWLNEDIFTAICWAYFCSLLFAISVVDGYYRLISPALCQNLFALGLGAAYWQKQLPAFLLLACLSGLVYALYHKLNKRHVTAIPFGPFLSLSSVLCRLLN